MIPKVSPEFAGVALFPSHPDSMAYVYEFHVTQSDPYFRLLSLLTGLAVKKTFDAFIERQKIHFSKLSREALTGKPWFVSETKISEVSPGNYVVNVFLMRIPGYTGE